MERQDILAAMTDLKLLGMRASFDEIVGKGMARRDEFYPLIASLIRAEHTHRQARSISYRITGAKFPVLKDLDKFTFGGTVIDEPLVRELETGAFLDARRNAIFIGGTGTGKTHLCIAAGHPTGGQARSARSRTETLAQETLRAARWDWLGRGFIGGCVITTGLLGAFVLYFTF